MIDFIPEIAGDSFVLKISEPNFKLASEIFDAIVESRDMLLRWYGWSHPHKTSRPEDCYNRLLNASQKLKQGSACNYNIFLPENKFAGTVRIHHIDQRRKLAEIGCWIRKSQTKNGLATKTLALLEEKYLRPGVIERFELFCDSENEKSISIAKKSGYTYEGKLRKVEHNSHANRKIDFVVYSKIIEDLNA